MRWFGVGEEWERVEIGAFELGELAVLEDECGDDVVLGEVFEDVLRGGDDFALAVLEWLGEIHLVEEDVAELLGRGDVEAMAGRGVDALGEVVDLHAEACGLLAEEVEVDADAGLLHAEEDGDEWEVDGVVDVGEGGALVEGIRGGKGFSGFGGTDCLGVLRLRAARFAQDDGLFLRGFLRGCFLIADFGLFFIREKHLGGDGSAEFGLVGGDVVLGGCGFG